ncbi:MAG TPA: transcriptional repressor [Longimicrobiaceae bacterium]|nr:transcriptional repressor [Longimicrobiaceae bacterium]
MKRPPIGQRNTRQRDAIAEVIGAAAGPLTAPEIAERAQREIPGLGMATVYRTLKLLQEAGRVRTVILPSGETRYESEGLGHHHHFHCRVCDGVYDLESCHVVMPPGARTEEGFVVEDHELTLYGVCPSCG